MEQHYAETVAEDCVRTFKERLFGDASIILHTSDVVRNREPFGRMKEQRFRERFYKELNALMASLDFQVVACVIRKDAHAARYGLAAIDPYMLSLHILVERFCFEIGDAEAGGLILAERRNPTLDHELELAFLDLKVRGTRYLQAAQIERRIAGLSLRSKSENIAGLQLADLVASPIGRHVLGKRDHKDYRTIESKFRRGQGGQREGYGLIVLPKN